MKICNLENYKLKKIFLIFFVFLMLGFSGCSSLVESSFKKSSIGFNRALQYSTSKQMLLNLVRLRYDESPVFLEVTSISTQYNFEGTLSTSATLKKDSAENSYGIGVGFGYAEKPTFTFAPLQGEKFARRLLSPIPIDHLILLLNSGWRVDRVLRICVQSINGIPNAPTASGPTPKSPPKYKRFLDLAYKLEELRKEGLIKFFYLKQGHKTIPVLKFTNATSLVKEVKKILGLKDAPYYPIVGPEYQKNPWVIRIETRSLIGVLFYLSQAVEVPQEDIKAKRVVQTVDSEGKPFSWDLVLGDLFKVRVSSSFPKDALIAVKYRGHWFYISDTDISTKSTFILLQQLFAMEASKGKGSAPILTLPLGD
ncbi:MAG: hypothetical protein GXO57_00850 [Thermodesulfobacteria bacterium]|nr:hypothetical protein [Thermodesulfobacteriota bacterium]